MLVPTQFSKGLLAFVALATSFAHAQQSNPPSGAVHSHYSRPKPIPVEAAPAPPPASYTSANRLNSAINPAAFDGPASPAPQPLPPLQQASPIPLAPRGAQSSKALIRTPTSGWGALSSVGASLGLVLAAFLCVAWLSKRYLPQAAGPLPKEVVESLGWAPLAGRQQMQLVRLGNKLLLIAVTPGSGAEPLGEVTDQAEVERLSAMCRRQKPESATRAFREVMSELEREPARGFVETQPRATRPTTTTTSTPSVYQVSSTPPQRPNPGRPLHG